MITGLIAGVGVKDEFARDRKVVPKWSKSSQSLVPIDALPQDEMIDSEILQGRLKVLKKQLKKLKRSNSEPDFENLTGCALDGAVADSKMKKRKGGWNPLHIRHHANRNDGNEELPVIRTRSNKLLEKIGRRIPHRPGAASMASKDDHTPNRRGLFSKSNSVKNFRRASLTNMQGAQKLWASQKLNTSDLEDLAHSDDGKRDHNSRTSAPPVIVRPKRNTSKSMRTLGNPLEDLEANINESDDNSEPGYNYIAEDDKDLAEVSPGIFVEFRTEEESWDAVFSEKYSETRCFHCRIPLVSVLDAQYVRCRKCCKYTPFVCMSIDAEPHGVGVGLTREECGDLLKDAKRSAKKKKSRVR